MNGKNKMIAWIAGTITVIILLAVLIVWMEPAKEGISRAEAYKALALVFADRQECESAEEQRQNPGFRTRKRITGS